jgi:hypothetical protein
VSKACCNTIDPVGQHLETLNSENFVLPTRPPWGFGTQKRFYYQIEPSMAFQFGFEIKEADLLQSLCSEISV